MSKKLLKEAISIIDDDNSKNVSYNNKPNKNPVKDQVKKGYKAKIFKRKVGISEIEKRKKKAKQDNTKDNLERIKKLEKLKIDKKYSSILFEKLNKKKDQVNKEKDKPVFTDQDFAKIALNY